MAGINIMLPNLGEHTLNLFQRNLNLFSVSMIMIAYKIECRLIQNSDGRV